MKYLSLILTLATAINIYGADGANIQWSAHPYNAGTKYFCQFDCRIENQGNENMWLWFVNPDNPHRTEEEQAYEFMHREEGDFRLYFMLQEIHITIYQTVLSFDFFKVIHPGEAFTIHVIYPCRKNDRIDLSKEGPEKFKSRWTEKFKSFLLRRIALVSSKAVDKVSKGTLTTPYIESDFAFKPDAICINWEALEHMDWK